MSLRASLAKRSRDGRPCPSWRMIASVTVAPMPSCRNLIRGPKPPQRCRCASRAPMRRLDRCRRPGCPCRGAENPSRDGTTCGRAPRPDWDLSRWWAGGTLAQPICAKTDSPSVSTRVIVPRGGAANIVMKSVNAATSRPIVVERRGRVEGECETIPLRAQLVAESRAGDADLVEQRVAGELEQGSAPVLSSRTSRLRPIATRGRTPHAPGRQSLDRRRTPPRRWRATSHPAPRRRIRGPEATASPRGRHVGLPAAAPRRRNRDVPSPVVIGPMPRN